MISCAPSAPSRKRAASGPNGASPKRAANQRFARDALDVGEGADPQPVAVALDLAKVGHVADVDDDAVAVAGILEAEKPALSRAPADAPAMHECKTEGFAQMTRSSNLRRFHWNELLQREACADPVRTSKGTKPQRSGPHGV